MFSYTHWTQVSTHRSGSINPSTAGRIASVLGLEAFRYSGDCEWYALDEDGDTCIAITRDLAIAMHNFSL